MSISCVKRRSGATMVTDLDNPSIHSCLTTGLPSKNKHVSSNQDESSYFVQFFNFLYCEKNELWRTVL